MPLPARRIPILAALGLLAAATAASAQQPTTAQRNAIKSACRADYESHCADVTPGGKAALQCLQQNMGDLSPSCQQAVGAIGGASAPTAAPTASAPAQAPPPDAGAAPRQLSPREQLAILRVDCGADYRRLCPGVRPGGGRAMDCLRAHARQLSGQCRSALASARQLP